MPCAVAHDNDAAHSAGNLGLPSSSSATWDCVQDCLDGASVTVILVVVVPEVGPLEAGILQELGWEPTQWATIAFRAA